jgi:hypothetical protein
MKANFTDIDLRMLEIRLRHDAFSSTISWNLS